MWHTEEASVIGRGHLSRSLPCQDRTFSLRENGVTALALADGAGSVRFSQEGADLAVRTVCQTLCDQFDFLIGRASPLMARQALLKPVLEQILHRSAQLEAASRELACTLLAVAVRGDQYLLFHVGDGVIAYRKNGRLNVASAPVNGEFTNTTTFVTSRDALVKSKVIKGSSAQMEGFLLMCDGCEPALYDKPRRKLAPLADLLLERAELLASSVSEDQLRTVLAGPIAHRTQDDCSMAFLTRSAGRFGRWDRMTPREKAAVLGITTRNPNRRRHQIRRYAAAYGVRTA